jgi:putative ABC transport system permease protein
MGIVCINYINLSIAQSHNRTREIGIRKCMGCSRSRLFVQFISEAGVTVVLSVCIGLAGVYFLLPVINGWMQVDLSLGQLMTWDKVYWLFLFTVGLIALAGYYPAMVLSGFDPVKAISGKGVTIGGMNQLFQKSLISFQYTVALVFLISSLIIVNQMEYLIHNDVGFLKESVMVMKLPKSDLSKLQTFRNEIEKSAGVERASLHHQAPMSTTSDGGFIKYDNRQQWEEFIVRDRWADDQFLDTYSLKLIAGRNIVLHDSLTEVLINETLLKKLNQSDPEAVLGKTILFDNSGRTGTIVGVVRDFHHRSLQNEIEPLAIYPFPGVFNQLGVKFSAGSTDHSFAGIEEVWKKSFPDDVFDFSFLDLSIANMYQVEITDRLMRVFALVSMVVCCLGILGLSAFYTLRRTREIGIRKVLGATTINIIIMLCRQYLSLLLASFGIATSVAYLVMNEWLTSFAYHIPLRWPVFVVPGVVMFVVTIVLVGGQSLKTALSNPATSLKCE